MLRSQSRVKKSWIRTKKIRPTLSEKKWSLHCLKEVGSTLFWRKKVGSRYPTFISNSADPTFYTIRIRLSAQTPSEKKVESALFEKKSDPHGLKKKSDPDIRLSFQTVRIWPSFTQYKSDFLLKQWGSKFLLKRSVLWIPILIR